MSMWQMCVTATQDANTVFNDATSEYLNIEDEAAVHRHIVMNKMGMLFLWTSDREGRRDNSYRLTQISLYTFVC